MIYEIAGLKIEMNPQYPRLARQSENYKSNGNPVMQIIPEQTEKLYKAICNRSPEDREYICSSAVFCREIIRHERFFLHASAVVVNGEAYLFSAPSGTGKSTHTARWLRKFDGAYILNDDKPVIFPQKDKVTVYGTPFAGKTNLQVNCAVPLKAVCFLNRGDKNVITPVTDEKAIALFLNNTYRPKNAVEMNLLFDMIEKVISRVKVFEMICTDDCEAADISYKAMKGL